MKIRAAIATLLLVTLISALPAAAEDAASAPRPAPEMEKWKWMVGTWTVTEAHEKTAFSPGGTGMGKSVITLGPGGFSLYYDYRSTGPLGQYAGRGLSAWDADAKIHRSVWTDNMTPSLVVSECREEGKDLVCTGDAVMNGQKITMRSRSIDPKPSGWTDVLETSADGANFQKMMTLKYSKTR